MQQFVRSMATGTSEKLKILAVLYKAGDAAKNPRMLGMVDFAQL